MEKNNEAKTENLLSTSLQEEVLIITLNDGKANAFGPPMIQALDKALDEAKNNAKAVIIKGRPGLFSAGFDLKVIKAGGKAREEMMRYGDALALKLFKWPQPVIYAVTGHAMALAAIMLLGGDYRIGLEGDFKIGLNEVAIGMPMPYSGVESARFRIPPKWLHRTVAHAEILDPAQAMDACFLDAVASNEDEMMTTALAEAKRIAAFEQEVFATTKMRIRQPCLTALEEIHCQS